VAIVPRWEWRTFGPGVEVAEPAVAALEPTGVQESDETYLLAEAGSPGATVKFRAGLMDVKQLVETDAAGLQQWRPVLKAELPVDAATVRQVWGYLGREAPALARDRYTAEQLIGEVAVAGSGVRPVAVHKRRVRYTINGCTSELSDVVADGVPTRTLAIESSDAAAVVEGVRSVGVWEYRNTAYPAGLAWVLGGAPERYAVIDCGTNSVKFHVAERDADGSWQPVVDRAEVSRLGEGLAAGGTIGTEPLDRTIAAIAGMVEEANANGALAIFAVGTAGLRIAGNGDAVVDEIARRTGVRIRVIPGEEEARLAYLAVRAGLGLADASIAVFDTGGGSTQLTFGHGESVDERFSVNVGAVAYTERFGLDGLVSEATLAEALTAIAADLGRLDGRPPVDALVGMGGAVTNITAVRHGMAVYDPDLVQGTVLERAEIDRQIERYRTTPLEARRSITGLQPKRAEVILAGACIVRTVMDKLGRDSLTVSDRGLRHGLLVDRFGSVTTSRRNDGDS
jgi:exopolyphosphatase/guanosine-5'-triphosphate,3'-diphosphate pyrophosphatase